MVVDGNIFGIPGLGSRAGPEPNASESGVGNLNLKVGKRKFSSGIRCILSTFLCGVCPTRRPTLQL